MSAPLGSKNLNSFLIVVVVLAFGSTYYFYSQYSDIKANPQKVAQEEARALVEQVSKLILLPDETPTIARVANPEQLRSQPFFVNAKEGDRVLMYANARKAILYSPADNRVVEVATINISPTGDTVPAPTPQPEPEEEE